MSWEYLGWKMSDTEEEKMNFKGNDMKGKDNTEKTRRMIGLLRIIIIVLAVIILALVIAFAVHSSVLSNKLSEVPGPCPGTAGTINLDPPDVLPPFHDLTYDEIMAVKDFLYNQPELNLVQPADIEVNSSYIYTIELNVPNKQVTLEYLDRGRAPPAREARVWIFRGDRPETFIEEYTIGPLPNPVYKKDHATFPFRYRPLTGPEMVASIKLLNDEVSMKASKILLESYGGRLGSCEEDCLSFQMIAPMSSASSGEPVTRKMWFWLAPRVEYFSLHPLDFNILLDLTSNQVEEYFIDKVYYGNEMFHSIDELVVAYNEGSVVKTKIEFPKKDKDLYSSLHRRGTEFPKQNIRPPQTFEPDGKRYSINGRHIEYMGWDFDVRMSSNSGPQLYDIKFNNKRIVYELSLQEIGVFYSANAPGMRFADYVDSVTMIGARARSLIPHGDCPRHATFMSASHVLENKVDPLVVERAFCVFEHNTDTPLRRHLAASEPDHGHFYEGMLDVVLTVRTVATIINYDYIFDFIFHQNGAVEVKAIPTGFILSAFRFPSGDDYGFRLRENMVGNMHHHIFHYKVDMDINGRENRFETISVEPLAVDNTLWSAEPSARYFQTKMLRRQMTTEKEAAISFDFDKPKYLTFYNKDEKSPTGAPRAYRLVVMGTSKQVIEKGKGQEPSVSWARHQVAVTKYKESERRSSSMYAIWDAEDPIVNFQKFIDDNDVLTDQDQVTWVTMGIHHIPHMEDFPVTPTVGLHLQFFLLPYNYFDEDPAMGSGDAIRITPRNKNDISHGINVQMYGRSENSQCFPRKTTFTQDMENNPKSIFD